MQELLDFDEDTDFENQLVDEEFEELPEMDGSEEG